MNLIQDRRLDPPPNKGMRIILGEGHLRAIDPSLNLAIAAGLGVTAAPTSANTTPGVADILATTGSAGDILYNATHLFIANADVLPTSTAGWERAAIAAF